MKSLRILLQVFVHITVLSSIMTGAMSICFDRHGYPINCSDVNSSYVDVAHPDFNVLSTIPTTENTPKHDSRAHLISSKCKTDGNVVTLPTYSVYLIGFLILLLTALTIIFAILLYRTKSHEYNFFVSSATPKTTLNVEPSRNYVTQSSQDRSLLNINPNQDFDCKQATMCNYDESQSKLESTAPPQSSLKIYKSVRNPVDHQMLLREQMKKICEDALAKSQNSGLTASLKDLNKLLNEYDDEKREISQESAAREKSASYPCLDTYDEPPARKNNVTDDDVDIPVYDCVPSAKNIVVNDTNTNYLLTLSQGDNSEPSYINARCIHN